MVCATSAVYTDASNFAFGGYLATCNGEPVRGMFSPADAYTSSTYREVMAVFYVLQSYAERLRHQRVRVFVDNMDSSRILVVGRANPHLQEIADDVFTICLNFTSPWNPSGCLWRKTPMPICLAGLLAGMTEF